MSRTIKNSHSANCENERASRCRLMPLFALIAVAGWVGLSAQPRSLFAIQQGIVVPQRAGALVQVDGVVDDEAPKDPSGLEGAGDYSGGAPLKTDPDLMARLDKAEQYRADGNYRVAVKLWQSVLDESSDTLFTDDGETYYSLSRQIESLLSALPPEGISAYRISADANASEVLAAGGAGNPEALGRVVRGYFLSSMGDDAAWELGCIYLDQHDFTGAMRMFHKIVDQYPDPSVSVAQVWLRIAIAYVWTGDRQSALNALAKANEAGADESDRLYQNIFGILEEEGDGGSNFNNSENWQDRVVGSRRIGAMPSVADPPSGKLRALWQASYSPRNTYTSGNYQSQQLVHADAAAVQKTIEKTEKDTIKKWRDGNWVPTSGVRLDGDRVLWRSMADLATFDRDVLTRPDPVWRSLWLNQFEIDAATRTWKQMLDSYGRFNEGSNQGKTAPSSELEVQLFGDRIARSMTVYRGVAYTLEGSEYSPWSGKAPSRVSRNDNYNWGTVPRRTRTNHLVAYDVVTGKLLWRQPGFTNPGETSTESANPAGGADENPGIDPNNPSAGNPMLDIGFMGAPVGYGELIIVPVNLSGSTWLYALNPADRGSLVWRAFLCDEPGGGSNPWSPIQLSLDGSTVYAACGTGVIFAVEAMTGTIRFARRYKRTGEPNNLMARFGNQMEMLDLDGWQEDIVVPAGNVLLSMSSDYNALWALDRQTAKLVWRTENKPFGQKFDYLIGVHDDYVFIGGREVVAAVSLKAQGRWVWVYSLPETSHGRAMLTNDALYVPIGSSIQKLGLSGKAGSGDVLATFPVSLGTGAPVGNLLSDGKRIWVDGGSRIYALGDDDGSIVDVVEDKGDNEAEKTEDAEADDKASEEQTADDVDKSSE